MSASDLDMLSVLSEPDRFRRYYHHVRGNFLTDEGEKIAAGMHEYLKDGQETMVWPHFAAWFFLKNAMMNFEKKANYKKIFDALESKPKVDEVFTRKILGELTQKSFAEDIAKKAQGISDGSDSGDLSDIEALVHDANSALTDLSPDEDPHLATDDHELLFDDTKTGPTIKPSLEGLREAFEGYGKGHFIVVGAHPDTGKTTFLMSEAAHALPQLEEDQVILYFNNEQAMRDMKLRMISSVLKRDSVALKLDPAKTMADYISAGGDRIKLYDKSYMTTKFVNERIKRHEGKIGLILFDQLWKIRGASRSQNDFMQLAHIFSWARDIAKEHAPVIAVHQADGNTFGEKYLGMEHLFGSRIAVQGEADAIITIGRITDGSTLPNLRHFHVPKNKLPSGSDPTQRNVRFDAFIDHDTVSFKDIL